MPGRQPTAEDEAPLNTPERIGLVGSLIGLTVMTAGVVAMGFSVSETTDMPDPLTHAHEYDAALQLAHRLMDRGAVGVVLGVLVAYAGVIIPNLITNRRSSRADTARQLAIAAFEPRHAAPTHDD